MGSSFETANWRQDVANRNKNRKGIEITLDVMLESRLLNTAMLAHSVWDGLVKSKL